MEVSTCDVCGKYYPTFKWDDDDMCSKECERKKRLEKETAKNTRDIQRLEKELRLIEIRRRM